MLLALFLAGEGLVPLGWKEFYGGGGAVPSAYRVVWATSIPVVLGIWWLIATSRQAWEVEVDEEGLTLSFPFRLGPRRITFPPSALVFALRGPESGLEGAFGGDFRYSLAFRTPTASDQPLGEVLRKEIAPGWVQVSRGEVTDRSYDAVVKLSGDEWAEARRHFPPEFQDFKIVDPTPEGLGPAKAV